MLPGQIYTWRRSKGTTAEMLCVKEDEDINPKLNSTYFINIYNV